MAEWALLTFVVITVGIAYWLNRRFFETWQVLAIWAGAGLILTIGLVMYIFTKVEATGSPWETQYEIEEL